MQRNVNDLIGFTMGAVDGEVGKVEEFYFDNQTWTVRYLIVKTGSWLFGRKVLISPEAVTGISWEKRVFPTNLTMEQIRTSPDIDTEKTISREHEIQLYEHYPWLSYWGSGFFPGGDGLIGNSNLLPVTDESILENNDENKEQAIKSHLLSTHQLTGYQMHATDGEIGYLDDFIIDDQTWKVEFLVIDIRKWLAGKKVLVAPKWVKEIQWENSLVIADLSVDSVKNSPVFNQPG
jgi:uncharacterized protein YrrD